MKLLNYLKSEKVMTISLVLAVVSAIFVHPDWQYLEYVDLRVLGLLFSLMVVVKGFEELGLFDLVAHRALGGVKSTTGLSLILVLVCFFSSMLITNDVALITFVPLAIITLKASKSDKLLIPVIVLQTLAANLGSMLTPIGNPQNLYLYTVSGVSVGTFLKTMAPLTGVSLVLLVVAVLFLPKREASTETHHSVKLEKKGLITYTLLFAVCLLVVFRLVPWYVAVGLTLLLVLVTGKWKVLGKVDYALLITFVGFFVFVGNVARVPQVSDTIKTLLQGREVLTSVLASQVVSNVPAAILLSGFTDKHTLLLVGTNVGGLGTLIASMASLISYKQYATTEGAKKGKYVFTFTCFNLVGLALLLVPALLLYK